MNWLGRLLRRRKLEAQLDAELRFHIEQRTGDLISEGVEPGEARRRAMIEFGGVERAKEECREARCTYFVESVAQDVRFGLRMLRKTPGFTAVAVLTLALGVGSSTALFGLFNALVLRELPVSDPGRLVQFYTTRRDGRWDGITVLQLRELEREQRVFTGIFGRSYPDNSNVEDGGRIWPINLGKVTGQYYSVLGVKPVLGRLITPQDAGISRGTPAAVAVISYQFWQQRYGGRKGAIGKTIHIEKTPFTIIGVTPKNFFGTEVGFALDVTIPITETPGMRANFTHGPWCQYGVGRLRSGITLNQARADLETIWPGVRDSAIPPGLNTAQLAAVQAQGLRVKSYPKDGFSYLRDQFSRPLSVLMEISVLILLLACVNLAMLLLARSSARRHEMAMRRALGASRRRLMRQMLTESLMISISGAALGIALATWGSRWLVAFWRQIPFNPPTVIDVSPDSRVLLFAAAAAVLTAIVFGLAPAFYGSREGPAVALQEGPRLGSGNARRLEKSLVTLQVALSLTLVAGGALLVRSLEKIRGVRSGFDYHGVAVAQLQGDAGGNVDYGDAYYERLVHELSALPGVQSVALSQMLPGAGFGGRWTVEANNAGSAANIEADSHAVSPEFFQTLKIPFVQGQDFSWQDDKRTRRVAVVSKSLADRLFPAGNSVGRFLRISGETIRRNVEVVGVVKDARVRDIRSPSRFAVYLPFLQEPKYWTNVEMRTTGPAGPVLEAAERRVAALGKQYVFNARTLGAVIDGELASERALALVSGFFSSLALLIALVGLEGLMAYTVIRRTREIGVRMALGAQPGNVVRTVIQEGMLLALAGIALGIGGALAAGKLLQSLLFGIQPTDPVTLVCVPCLFALTTLAASCVPARHAARVDPNVALRHE